VNVGKLEIQAEFNEESREPLQNLFSRSVPMDTEVVTVENDGHQFQFTANVYGDSMRIMVYVKEIWWGLSDDDDLGSYIGHLTYKRNG